VLLCSGKLLAGAVSSWAESGVPGREVREIASLPGGHLPGSEVGDRAAHVVDDYPVVSGACHSCGACVAGRGGGPHSACFDGVRPQYSGFERRGQAQGGRGAGRLPSRRGGRRGKGAAPAVASARRPAPLRAGPRAAGARRECAGGGMMMQRCVTTPGRPTGPLSAPFTLAAWGPGPAGRAGGAPARGCPAGLSAWCGGAEVSVVCSACAQGDFARVVAQRVNKSSSALWRNRSELIRSFFRGR